MKLNTQGFLAGPSRNSYPRKFKFLNDEFKPPLFRVYGEGAIGDKALNLKEYRFYLSQLGFALPGRHVLAESIINSFSNHPLLQDPTEDLETKLKQCKLDGSYRKILESISESIPNKFVFVRSSANGDSRGTGFFDSVPCPNNPEAIENAVVRVINSYFKNGALNFFKSMGVSATGGVLIEGMVPADFSGFCYTTLPFIRGSEGRSEYCQFIPFIGGGNQIFSKEGYLNSEGKKHENVVEALRFKDGTLTKVLVPPPGYADRLMFDFQTSTAAPSYHLTFLQYAMSKIEQDYGKPHYLEFAATDGSAILRHFGYAFNKEDMLIEPLFWVTQIAELPNEEIGFNGDLENIVYEADNLKDRQVVGTGDTYHSQLVLFSKQNEKSEKELVKFNKANHGYVLISDWKDLWGMLASRGDLSKYSAFYKLVGNGGAVLETTDNESHPSILTESHSYGFFGTIGIRLVSHQKDSLQSVRARVAKLGLRPAYQMNGLEIYDHTVRLLTSEEKGKAVLSVCK